MHTHTHTHTNTHTHTYIHTYIHTQSHGGGGARGDACYFLTLEDGLLERELPGLSS